MCKERETRKKVWNKRVHVNTRSCAEMRKAECISKELSGFEKEVIVNEASRIRDSTLKSTDSSDFVWALAATTFLPRNTELGGISSIQIRISITLIIVERLSPTNERYFSIFGYISLEYNMSRYLEILASRSN